MNQESITTNIKKTLARYSALQQTPTLIELHHLLELPIDLLSLKNTLEQLLPNQEITCVNGYWQLTQKPQLHTKRHKQIRASLEKNFLAQKVSKIINSFPWIKAVAIYGSLSRLQSNNESDIDFFIITSANRVWSARFFINFVFKILKLRPDKKNKKNRFCFSYWADETNLDLSVANYDNDYYYYCYGPSSFRFLTGEPAVIKKFFDTNQKWISEIMPNWQPSDFTTEYKKPKAQSLLETIFGLIPEAYYRKWQLKILPSMYHQAHNGKSVIINHHLIKLHHREKREDYNKKMSEASAEIR